MILRKFEARKEPCEERSLRRPPVGARAWRFRAPKRSRLSLLGSGTSPLGRHRLVRMDSLEAGILGPLSFGIRRLLLCRGGTFHGRAMYDADGIVRYMSPRSSTHFKAAPIREPRARLDQLGNGALEDLPQHDVRPLEYVFVTAGAVLDRTSDGSECEPGHDDALRPKHQPRARELERRRVGPPALT
jgi:hypothetical protein